MFVIMFIIGTIFGSFYNVIGYRIPKNMSIIYPSSHCTKCNHKLKFYELIPILSYIFLKGKCKNCGKKISPFYPFFEFITGLLFSISYLSFGLNIELIISLTFISLLIIITISDCHYMIIPDEILIIFGSLLLTEKALIYGPNTIIKTLLNGFAAFIIMYMIKKIGDRLFKKESMGGGDIKLMFILGMVLDFPIAILSIFVGSFVGLPISLLSLKNNKEHIIPFGPFLSVGALILHLMQINTDMIIKYLTI